VAQDNLTGNLKPSFGSTFRDNQEAFSLLNRQVLDPLRSGWNSYDSEPPNHWAKLAAIQVLRRMEFESLLPSQIRPTAEGGLAISIVSGSRRGEFEIFNSEEIVAATYTRGKDDTAVWELKAEDQEITGAILKIREYLTA
jgi:hypothetical protein